MRLQFDILYAPAFVCLHVSSIMFVSDRLYFQKGLKTTNTRKVLLNSKIEHNQPLNSCIKTRTVYYRIDIIHGACYKEGANELEDR